MIIKTFSTINPKNMKMFPCPGILFCGNIIFMWNTRKYYNMTDHSQNNLQILKNLDFFINLKLLTVYKNCKNLLAP